MSDSDKNNVKLQVLIPVEITLEDETAAVMLLNPLTREAHCVKSCYVISSDIVDIAWKAWDEIRATAYSGPDRSLLKKVIDSKSKLTRSNFQEDKIWPKEE